MIEREKPNLNEGQIEVVQTTKRTDDDAFIAAGKNSCSDQA